MISKRRLRIMRLALTRATARWGTGGRLKSQGMVKPVSLAGQMSKTYTSIWIVMRNGMPAGAYEDRAEAAAHARAIGGPGKGHAIALVSLELVHKGAQSGRKQDAEQEHLPGERADRKEERR